MAVTGGDLLIVQHAQQREGRKGNQGRGGNGDRLKNPPDAAEHGHRGAPASSAGKTRHGQAASRGAGGDRARQQCPGLVWCHVAHYPPFLEARPCLPTCPFRGGGQQNILF